MEKLGQLLIEKNYSLSSTESFTVGRFGGKIGVIPGISAVYKGTLVSYQTIIKHTVLNIDQSLIDTYGVVSRECAKQMCINGQKLFDSDICISFTGNAGPSAMEGKEVGLIYIGIAFFNQVYTYEYHLKGERLEIVNQAIDLGSQNLYQLIKENENGKER